MAIDNIIQLMIDAGFTRKQAECLDENFARYPHTHTVEEIEGLDEILEGEDFEDDEG